MSDKVFSNIKTEVENLKKKIQKQTSVIAEKDIIIEELKEDLKNSKRLYASSNLLIDEYRNFKIDCLKKISRNRTVYLITMVFYFLSLIMILYKR
jgi:hypothetical protein